MIAELLLVALAVPALVASAYLAILALFSGDRRSTPADPPRLRLDVVVPAHDEEAGIAPTVHDLAGQDYPASLFRVLVIADNCADHTAERAAEAGATVWARSDAKHRGKGYALAFAFERLRAEGRTDAVVVLDADTRASPNLLSVLAARLQGGARAVQADYGVSNAEDSWRTRLLRIALALFHTTRSLGRERLGLSCGLRGNGMAFDLGLLSEVPYDAFSIVEDLEYGIRLGQAGVRVAYAPEAHVWGEMPAGESASRSQRHRWEGGRRQLAVTRGPGLLVDSLRRLSALRLDLALDLLVPPLSSLGLICAAGLGGAVWLTESGHGTLALQAWGLVAALLAIYVARGWQLSGTGARGLSDLARAPAYALWKLTLPLRHVTGAKGEWVRTQRKTEVRQ